MRLLRRDQGAFVTVGTGRVDARGGYRVRSAAPVAAGTYAHRVTISAQGSTRTVKRFGVLVMDPRPMVATPTPTTHPDRGPPGRPERLDLPRRHPDRSLGPVPPITWSVTGTAPYAEALADLETAFSRLAAATGLTFEQVADPEASTFDVTWTNAAADARLAGTVVGFGGNQSTARPGGVSEIVSGYVLLDQEHALPAGFAARRVLGQGDAPRDDPRRRARPRGRCRPADVLEVAQTPADFGAGDLTGLTAVGAGQGCFPAL